MNEWFVETSSVLADPANLYFMIIDSLSQKQS